jgi:nucleoside-diphosphate-sugar epimerase
MVEQSDITVSSQATLKEAMQSINTNGIGIVFVVDEEDKLLATATDGDIRRGILDGKEVTEPIQDVANTDPLIAYKSWSDAKFQQKIDNYNLKHRVGENAEITIPILNEQDEIISITHIDSQGNQIDSIDVRTSANTVLVIGGAGYLGSQLSRELLQRGYTVRVLDNLLFGTHGLNELINRDDFTLIEGDMRSIDDVVEGIKKSDAAIHLGGLVGDPASGLDPEETLELNYHSSRMIAEICKYHQVNRFIFASTCSVYGKSSSPEELLTEESELNPVSLYAQTNIQSEKVLLDLEDKNFSPTIFRMATLYGYSPRMRFDLVVNILTAKAYNEGVVPIFGGDQYRPNLHVRDAARAYADCLEASLGKVKGEIFNIGSDEQNYQIKEVGEIVASCFPNADIDWQREKEDERSYQVDFSKVNENLGYQVEETIEDAVLEIKEAFEQGEFEDYSKDKYSNYRTTKQYLD